MVTVGTALVFVPITKMELGYGSPMYKFLFYGLELSEEQHANFLKFAHPYEAFPASLPAINESPVWLASSNGEEIRFTKEGYLCLTPINYGPTLCADDSTGACLYPNFKGIKCAYINNPNENNFQKVSQFIQKSLKEAKVNCNDQCLIKEMGENQVRINEFARTIVYFEDLVSQDSDKYSNLVKQEAEKSLNYFQKTGWKASKNDITNKERGWSPGVFSSIQITASNNDFNCLHTITISNQWGAEATGSAQKREMIECSIQPSMIE
ncbi:MAG: hypothetical protein M1514_02820 [Patescibacteria group bacterium]|nr:hypothetical protein [Patescibacteria group bacterium]